ncbi:acetoacetate decarboxylase [Kibdelosporangium phytohabitans]|uniref:Acetoacetate decarboxylase n=1 Tax=Kibdelosporangium phytohabitans TaxID=860235 RepID=A0A0N9I738_9PSEU|nr:acetoacetate decarboxylase [Kibdelosporangium phytohabitans]ALG10310.1 acetoacetate decarboxylase [Kibdelosporangium phytohabitans]MBE1461344.1 acetoacetate decarboxylase [Kibdelosporangium phytohabitans]
MRIDEVRRHITTPLTSPAFAPVAARFTDREYLNIVYRTDIEALRAVVPEPLRIVEPLVRFEVMQMGDVTAYGPYTEAGQAVEVEFDGERGEYLHAMYLDNFAATAAGREVSAYPKVLGQPRLYVDSGALVGTVDYGTLRVATATMGYKHHALDARDAEAQITVPTFMLKTIPGYDGTPRVQELVRTEITDVVVKEAFTGPARLQLFQHVLAPMADLPVLEVVSASHIRTDLTLAGVKPVFDYLEEFQ